MSDLIIRTACDKDVSGIIKLLYQVNQVHADGRPDLFKSGGIKYTEESLVKKLDKADEIIFVAVDATDKVLGYTFCVFEETKENTSVYYKKTLYIDDLCVDENARRLGIGNKLYEYTKAYAKNNNFDRITLHVWECNPNAKIFYESIGMKVMYTAMEDNL